MDNFNQFKKDFKRDLLIKIVVSMKHGWANKEESRSLAREVLKVFGEHDSALAFQKLNKLSERHPEILDIFIKRGYEFDVRDKREKINQVIVYLKTKGGVN